VQAIAERAGREEETGDHDDDQREALCRREIIPVRGDEK
jgi:hypothetical protein